MGIFASIFAFIGRFLGRALSMAMGWATILLFGRVPQSKQLLLSLISLGSLAWVVMVVGVLIPSIGALLISFAPIPDSLAEQRIVGIEIETLVRIGMLVAALVTPLLIGVGSYFMLSRADRPAGAGILRPRAVRTPPIEGRVDGEDRPGDVGPATRIVQGIGSAAAAVERALGGTPIALVAGAVRHALPEPDHDPDALIESSEPEPVAPVARPAETSVSHRAS